MIAIELEGLQKRYNTDIEHEVARVPVKTDYSVTLILLHHAIRMIKGNLT